MGWQTTVVVNNDALGYIEEDPEFGKNLVRAILKLNHPHNRSIPVHAGGMSPAAKVIEQHDSEYAVTVEMQHGTGKVVPEE